MPISELMVGVGGDTSALAASFGRVSGLVGKLGGMFESVGVGIAAGVAVAAVAVGAFAFRAAQEIDEGADKIRVGTGLTGKALDDLVGSMKNVGKEVPESFDVVGGAIADLNTRLGLTGEPLETMAVQMVNLAQITEEDLSQVISTATRVFGDWGVATEDQSATLDDLFKVSQATGIGVTTLSDQLVKYGAPMRQMGFSIEETSALLGKFEKEGVNAELVMGSMRIALGKMAREGEEPISTFRRVTGEIKNAGDAGEANALALELFGARAGPDMAAAIREGRFEVGELMEQLEGSGDTINAAAEDSWDFGERLKILGNNAKVILEPLGKGLMTALDWAVKAIIKAIEWVTKFVDKLKNAGGNFKKARDIIRTTFNTIKTIIQTTVDVIVALWDNFGKHIWSQIKNVFEAVYRIIKSIFDAIMAIWEIFAGIFSGDWSRVWEGVKALFGAIWDAIKAIFVFIWNTIKNFLKVVWNAIKAVAKVIWNAIKAYFTAWLNIIKGIFTAIWNTIKGILRGVWNAIKAVAETTWNLVKVLIITPIQEVWNFLVSAWGTIQGLLSGAWEGIKSVASTIWNGIKTAIVSPIEGVWGAIEVAINTIKGGLEGAWNTIKDVAGAAWDGLVGIVTGAWDGIKTAISSGINIAIKVINAFIRAYNAIPLLGNIDTISPVSLAGGGIVMKPTLAMIGEEGPEAVVPLTGRGAGPLGTINFYGDLSFPNVRNARDAEGFLNEATRRAVQKKRTAL